MVSLAALGAWLSYRAVQALRWLTLRLRLVAAARAHPEVNAGWSGMNVKLTLTCGGRAATAVPMSLGVLREDPPWTWWWLTIESVVPEARYSMFVELQSERAKWRDNPYYKEAPERREIVSLDDAFNERFAVYTYSGEYMETKERVLSSAAVRSEVAELVSVGTDGCSLGTQQLSASPRRKSAAFEDALAQMQRMERLAVAVEAAFHQQPYR